MPQSKFPILFVLSLLSFVLPAFSDPLLGPPREIAPVRIDAAYGGRGYAAVATNGSTSLVAWQDANAERVLFTILGPDGKPLAEVPRELPGFQQQPGGRIVAAATDGTDFVVGWISSTSNTGNLLRVARIRASGEVGAIREMTASAPVDVQIAWNGSKYLLVYQNGISNGEVYGQFLDRDATADGSQMKLGGVTSNSPVVASAAGDFLVAFRSWSQAQPAWNVKAVRVRSSGVTTGPYIVAEVQPQASIWDDDVTSDGVNFTIVWSESPGTTFRQIRTRMITLDGVLSPVVTLSDGLADSTSPSIAWTSSGYVMTYLRFLSSTSGYSSQLRASRFNAQLQHTAEQTLDESGSPAMPDVDSAGSTAVVSWVHPTGGTPATGTQIFVSESNDATTFSSPADVSRAARQQAAVVVAGNSIDSLVAWVERVGMDQKPAVRAQLLSRTGSEPVHLSDSDANQLSPAVAASPSDFLVAWIERGASATLSGRVVDRNGTPLSVAPLVISTDVDPSSAVAVSWGGDRYGVAFVSTAGRIKLALLTSAGAVVVQVSPDRPYFKDKQPALAFDGSQFLVAWSAAENAWCQNLCPTAYDVRAARVLPDGHVLDAAPPQVFETIYGTANVRTLWDGQHFVISRSDYYSVAARRMRSDGALIDPMAGITLTREVSYSSALAYDGQVFTLGSARYGPDTRTAKILLKTFARLEDAAITPFVEHDTAATSFDIASPSAGSFVLAESVKLFSSPYFGSTRVFATSGSASPSNPLRPPAAVTAYSADGTVIVQWQDRSDDETSFIVEEDHHPFTRVAEVPANQTIAFLSGIEPGYHYYRVVAVRGSSRSEGSNVATLRSKARHRSVRR